MEENTNTTMDIETAVRTQPSEDATVEKLRRRLHWLDDGRLDSCLLLLAFICIIAIEKISTVSLYAVISGKMPSEKISNMAEQLGYAALSSLALITSILFLSLGIPRWLKRVDLSQYKFSIPLSLGAYKVYMSVLYLFLCVIALGIIYLLGVGNFYEFWVIFWVIFSIASLFLFALLYIPIYIRVKGENSSVDKNILSHIKLRPWAFMVFIFLLILFLFISDFFADFSTRSGKENKWFMAFCAVVYMLFNVWLIHLLLKVIKRSYRFRETFRYSAFLYSYLSFLWAAIYAVPIFLIYHIFSLVFGIITLLAILILAVFLALGFLLLPALVYWMLMRICANADKFICYRERRYVYTAVGYFVICVYFVFYATSLLIVPSIDTHGDGYYLLGKLLWFILHTIMFLRAKWTLGIWKRLK